MPHPSSGLQGDGGLEIEMKIEMTIEMTIETARGIIEPLTFLGSVST